MRTAFRTFGTNIFITGLGVGVLATYPQIGAYGGLHGLLVYSACGAVPFLFFAALGPLIRRQMPEAFVLTEWIRYRYGVITSLVISACTILTIFLFMVSELSSMRACVETLSNVPGLPVLIVEAVVVSIYTAFGGFYVSFLTDNLQVFSFIVLLVVCIIATGCTVEIDTSKIGPSKLLLQNQLGWKLLYILLVAIITNDMFMAGFWLRTFAAKTDRDLCISCGLTAIIMFLICSTLGIAGLLAVWSGLLDPESPTFGDDSQNALYLLMGSLPSWVSGFVLVFCVMLSSCTFDSLQSAIVSTISNDWARNRVRIIWVRVFVMAVMVPCIVVALKGLNVLNIYLIVDVLSAAVVPVLFFGLNKVFYFITGFEIILSIIGGIIGVFVYGTIYYGSAYDGGQLLIMYYGLYLNDWGPFGAFVAAPVCSVIGALVGLAIRDIILGVKYRKAFAVFDRPADGSPFPRPLDADLFTLKNPWYDHMPKSIRGFCMKLDYWIFVQGEASEAENNAGVIIPTTSSSDSKSLASSNQKKGGVREEIGQLLLGT